MMTEDHSSVSDQSDRVKELIERIMAFGERLLPKIADVEAEKMGDMVESELQQTTDAIEAAAKRFAVSNVDVECLGVLNDTHMYKYMLTNICHSNGIEQKLRESR